MADENDFRSIGMDSPASKPPQPKTGSFADSLRLQKLTGYEKLELLGFGEYGEVWKALAPGGVEVAIKIVMRTLDHEATRRELNALEKIKQLHHPFLLQTHSFGMLDDKLTIVMELAEGSLSDQFKHRKDEWSRECPPEDLVTFFGQAAEALDYLQNQHVSHRDIKPQNLLYLQGFAKVADFGFARGQDQGIEDASGICGTPSYMAPELWSQRVSRHSDQYSLAATYAHMRLGRMVFGGSFHEVFVQHLNAEPILDPLPPREQAVLKRRSGEGSRTAVSQLRGVHQRIEGRVRKAETGRRIAAGFIQVENARIRGAGLLAGRAARCVPAIAEQNQWLHGSRGRLAAGRMASRERR